MHVSKLATKLLMVLMLASLSVVGVSCDDTETTDRTPFAIFYSGMTDIGPSMVANISAPTYIGTTPTDFAITQVLLDQSPVSENSFIIDPTNGGIAIKNTEELSVGLYEISVSCVSNGKMYLFENAVSINMMRAVPEGIKVEPNLLVIDYAEVMTSGKTAKVTTEGEHVTISQYRIAAGQNSEFFAVSAAGVVGINTEYKGDILPGLYKVSLVLKTEAGEGLFQDAVTFNITAKPLELTYAPNAGKLEEETAGPTSYTTNAPLLKGSLDGIVYAINKVTPATDKFNIDPTTGVISLATGHGFKQGDIFAIDVIARNDYNTAEEQGTVFENAFVLEVVGFIAPIENFGYADASMIQSTPFTINYNEGFAGDEVTFSFVNLPAAVEGQLSIDAVTGAISAKKNNTIAVGTYTITVKASNAKGEVETSFTLSIEENKNFFTYIKYGNNLGLPVDENAYQYRVTSASELASFVVPAPQTDIAADAGAVKWSVSSQLALNGIKIDENGALDLSEVSFSNARCGMATVVATVGTGDAAVSVKVPVFFHMSAAVNGVTVHYTPFVFQANPRTGGRSVSPTVTGAELSGLSLDYRRTFNYFNLNGSETHLSGQMSASTEIFLNQVWRNYFSVAGGTVNYGSKNPVSFFVNESKLNMPLAYIDHSDKAVVVNPGKWMGEDKTYANGVFSGQITFVTNSIGDGINSGSQMFPILVWFDEKF